MNKFRKIAWILLTIGAVIGIPIQIMGSVFGLFEHSVATIIGTLFVITSVIFFIQAGKMEKKNETHN